MSSAACSHCKAPWKIGSQRAIRPITGRFSPSFTAHACANAPIPLTHREPAICTRTIKSQFVHSKPLSPKHDATLRESVRLSTLSIDPKKRTACILLCNFLLCGTYCQKKFVKKKQPQADRKIGAAVLLLKEKIGRSR